MSLVITGTNLIITLFFLIALNGFCLFVKIPIIGVPIAIISMIFLIGFYINFSGINIILSLILLVCIVANLFLNFKDYQR